MSRMMDAALGKMPTTSARHFLVEPFQRVHRVQLGPVLDGKRHVGEDVMLAGVHERGERWLARPELLVDMAPSLGRRVSIRLPEGLANERGIDMDDIALGDVGCDARLHRAFEDSPESLGSPALTDASE